MSIPPRPAPRPVLRQALFTAGLSLAAASAAFAATPIDETRALDPDGRVEIDNLKGRIEVQAWERDEVQVSGSLGEGVERLRIDGDRRRLRVQVKYPDRGRLGLVAGGRRSEPTELRLMVPARADLAIDAVSAAVDVRGMASRELLVDSVSGAVEVVGAPARIEVDSVSGAVRLTVNSANVDVESVSGGIDVRGRLDGEVSVETVSGGVALAVHPQSRVRELDVASVSGDMRLRTALAPGGAITVESVSGDIDLQLPPDLSAEVRGKSFSGDLEATGAIVERPRHGPGRSFVHRYGEGEGRVSIETFSGDARVRVE